MGKIILVCVEPSCLELLSKQCRVLMPVPSSGMVVGGAVHRLRLQSYPPHPQWPAGHTATKNREGQGQGEDTSSYDTLACSKVDGFQGSKQNTPDG